MAAYKAKLDMPIEELEISDRAASPLRRDRVGAFIRRGGLQLLFVGELIQLSGSELLKVPNIGWKCIREIKEALAKMGLTLDTRLDGWTPPAHPEK